MNSRRSRSTRRLRSVPGQELSEQLNVHVGDRLRGHRERCGLTQENAAVEAGITRNALNRLEIAQFPNPYLSTMLGLMRVYRLGSLDELLGPIPSQVLAEAWEADGWRGTRRARA